MVFRNFARSNGTVIAATAAILLGTASAHATTIYSNNFASNTTGFTFSSGTGLQKSPNNTPLLGYFTQGGYADLSLTGLQTGATETVSFNLYALETLDGDGNAVPVGYGSDPFTVTVTQNGTTTTLFNQTFSNWSKQTQNYPKAGSAYDTGAIGVNTLGYSTSYDSHYGYLNGDATYALSLSFVSTGSTADIKFVGNSDQAWPDEAYGIGNVAVSQVTLAEPTSLAILGAGVASLIGLRRRVRA